MLGWTNAGICVIAAILFYEQGHHDLFWSAVITGIVGFGSHVIMQNYLQRPGYGDVRKTPNWLSALLSALEVMAMLVGIGLLITALAFRYW
jgi:hypothetical protein